MIPNNTTRKRFHPFDTDLYKRRDLIEREFCRLKDWRRIATRYDKLGRQLRRRHRHRNYRPGVDLIESGT